MRPGRWQSFWPLREWRRDNDRASPKGFGQRQRSRHRQTADANGSCRRFAGQAHLWGYLEPSEAANELLEASIEDLVEDMKRKAELGLAPAAEAMCAGIVCGLYRARRTESDGALGWDPDFPAERAGYTVEELVRAYPPAARQAALERLAEVLVREAPEWAEMFRRLAQQGIKD